MHTLTRVALLAVVTLLLIVSSLFADQVIYEWEQSLEELNVYIRPPPGITASMILCEITANHVTLGLRGTNDKFLNVSETSRV